MMISIPQLISMHTNRIEVGDQVLQTKSVNLKDTFIQMDMC